jgi:RNA-directed DNA polymerase
MSKTTEFQLVAVPAKAKRTGETLRPWLWVETTVWTERMLTALEQGVKGGKWFSDAAGLV